MQEMHYEKKFTDVEPHAEIVITHKDRIDLDKKRFELGQRYGFEMAKEHHELRAVRLMTIVCYTPDLKRPKRGKCQRNDLTCLILGI